MDAKKVLEDLDAVLNVGRKKHDFRKAGLTGHSGLIPFSDTAALETMIRKFPAKAGWIARQSRVVVLPDSDDMLGAVLEAELGSDAASLQIRRMDREWVWTELKETEGDGLCEDVVLVTVQGRAARYRRYWNLPEDGAAEVIACRLVGYTEFPK